MDAQKSLSQSRSGQFTKAFGTVAGSLLKAPAALPKKTYALANLTLAQSA